MWWRKKETDEEKDFRLRRGRFANIEPDTPERRQIMPGPLIPSENQTHNRNERGGIIGDGSPESMDS